MLENENSNISAVGCGQDENIFVQPKLNISKCGDF